MKREKMQAAYVPKKGSSAWKILGALAAHDPLPIRTSELTKLCKVRGQALHGTLYWLSASKKVLQYGGRKVGYSLTAEGKALVRTAIGQFNLDKLVASTRSKGSNGQRSEVATPKLTRHPKRGSNASEIRTTDSVVTKANTLAPSQRQNAAFLAGSPMTFASTSEHVFLREFADYHPEIYAERQALVERIKVIDDFASAWAALRKGGKGGKGGKKSGAISFGDPAVLAKGYS